MSPWRLRIDRALPGTPPSVKCAPAASSWGSKDRSAPRNGTTLEGIGENARNSPMHGGVPSLSVTSIFTYRARSIPSQRPIHRLARGRRLLLEVGHRRE